MSEIVVIPNNNNVSVEQVSPNEITITKNENTVEISQTGAQGSNGVGVPPGGTIGQVLAKNSNTDYDTEWVDQSGGGGAVDSVNGQTGIVVLDADDIDDSSTTNKFVTSTDLINLSNLSGTNTGDQDLSGYELISNKENTTINSSTTKYPTVNLLNIGLGTKVSSNSPITGATKTKLTYDSKGLITSGADATTADINDSSNRRYVTDAQLTVIGNTSGTNTGDQDLSGYELLSNKDNGPLSSSTTTYPTSGAVKTVTDGKANTSHNHALSDLTQSGATTGQVPKWNGTAWAPANDDTGGDFTDLGDVPSSYTGQADKWVKVKTDELGLDFDDLPIADINTPGLIDVGGQTLSGGKSFASTFSDADNFSINLTSQAVVVDTFNNTNSINVGFYPTLVIGDDVDHDGLNVGGLIGVSQLGNGNLNNILGGIAFTAAHEGSGVASAVLGISGAANTAAGSIGDITLCLGASLSVEHEGDGEITTGTSLNANVINFGGGDIVEAICVNGSIESDGATGDIVDGYVLKCDTHDAINKYGIWFTVPGVQSLLQVLSVNQAFDQVPNPLVDGANISTDAALGNIFDIELEGSRTLDNPTNAKDGQELIFRILQGTTGSHTLTLDSKFRFGATLPSITLSTSVGALDYLTVRYNLASDTFDVLDFKGGF